MRVVLYAEGTADLGTAGLPPAPGHPIENLGPAHVLVAKALAHAKRLPEPAIQFEQPLRTTRGRLARGSDLVARTTLRRLLSWPDASRRPELAIVLVDADADSNRRQKLLTDTADLPVSKIIAVAVQEFEAWLISDPEALIAVLGSRARLDAAPEVLPRRRAKELLTEWCADSDELRSAEQIRLSLAQHLDPLRLRARSGSFKQLLEDLGRL